MFECQALQEGVCIKWALTGLSDLTFSQGIMLGLGHFLAGAALALLCRAILTK